MSRHVNVTAPQLAEKLEFAHCLCTILATNLAGLDMLRVMSIARQHLAPIYPASLRLNQADSLAEFDRILINSQNSINLNWVTEVISSILNNQGLIKVVWNRTTHGSSRKTMLFQSLPSGWSSSLPCGITLTMWRSVDASIVCSEGYRPLRPGGRFLEIGTGASKMNFILWCLH